MSGARSEPPDIPGFTIQRWLGGGGFADVFLYSQARPAREVAIKVLRTAALDDERQGNLDAEANLMARVSAHPYIVTVHDANVAADGRFYLVMEYYPKPHFGLRARQGGVGVSEALRVGVQVASAAEAAHRAGILHRDIKPANILVSEYGRPGLTDFGIAAASGADGAEEAVGVSIPFASPEVLSEASPGDEQSDVYSLAATLYTLLAGRSPFEIPGGDNSELALTKRVLGGTVPPIARPDVPSSLEHLLAQALARNPSNRPRSALALARGLQEIERELGFPATEFETQTDDGPERFVDLSGDEDDRTRGSRIQVVRQEPVTRSVPPEANGLGMESATVARSNRQTGPNPDPGSGVVGAGASPAVAFKVPPLPAPPVTDTVGRPRRPPVSAPAPASTAARPSRVLVIVAAVVLAALVVVVGVALATRGSGNGSTAAPSADEGPTQDSTIDAFLDMPTPPTSVVIKAENGVVRVTWEQTAPKPGDKFRVRRIDGTHSEDRFIEAVDASVELPGVAAGERPCVEVLVVRGSRISEPSPPACAQV